jgi:hypothetical protein
VLHYSTRNDSLKEEAQSMFKGLPAEDLHCSLTTILFLAAIPSRSCPVELGFGKPPHAFSLKYGFMSGVSSAVTLRLTDDDGQNNS